MPDSTSQIPPLDPRDDLADRLSALGRTLTSRESIEPPAALLHALHTRRTRPRTLRLTLLAAAIIALSGAAVYITTRPAQPSAPPPIVVHTPANTATPVVHNLNSPTLATLRKLNRDPAPESLHFPVLATTGAASPTVRAGDARDPAALARIAGAGR
jgi:hypothetical protein